MYRFTHTRDKDSLPTETLHSTRLPQTLSCMPMMMHTFCLRLQVSSCAGLKKTHNTTYYFQSLNLHRQTSENYPDKDFDVLAMPALYTISALEMACKRQSVQGFIRFDERFGLGTNSSHVARKKYGLKMRYALASNCITFLTNHRDQYHAQEVAHIHRCRCTTKSWSHSLLQTWQSSMVDFICFALQSAKMAIVISCPLCAIWQKAFAIWNEPLNKQW